MNRTVAFLDRAMSRVIAFAEHHTRNAAYILAAFLLLTACALPWIKTPMGKAPRGVQFSLWQDLPAEPLFQLGSFGVAGLAVFAIALAAGFLDRRAVLVGGLALLALTLTAPLQIAFSNPDISRRLDSEFTQKQNVNAFTASYLPVNRGRDPRSWASLDYGTVGSRLVSAWYFLTSGWYVFAVAACLVFLESASRFPAVRARLLLVCPLILLVYAALFLARPTVAYARLNQAYLAQSRGDLNGAVALYRSAMRLDRWFALGPELYSQIGEIHVNLGVLNTPEYHLYKAQVFENRSLQSIVIDEYRQAAGGGGDLAIVGRREAARASASLGLRLFGQRAFSGALARWRQSLAEDPFQLQTLFFATRAHFEAAQYVESVSAGEAFCRRTSNVIAMADAYSNMGDSYTKLDDHARARTCYALSFKLDYTLNARGLGALAGN